MTLNLEYSCTEAEMKEAKTLQVHQQYGKGSKWRAQLVLWGMLVLGLAAAYFRFKREIAPEDRSWFIALVVVIYIVVVVVKRLTRRKAGGLVHLEVNERELVFGGGEGRSVFQWSAFGQCLESPRVFVLVDRPKTMLFVVPKRAFPDEAAQSWFRLQANQPQSVAPTATAEAFVPGRFVSGQGVAVSLRLKFRDYLNRNFTSWRVKGMFLGIFAFLTGLIVFMPAPPHLVNPPWKVFLMMLPIFLGSMTFVVLVWTVLAWGAERKRVGLQHLVLTTEGIEFVAQDTNGRLPWSTYQYYLENRWSFFVWHPRGGIWLMLPKREFAAASDLAQCRELLEAKLKPSRWFYW